MKKNPTAFSGFVNKMNKTNLIIFLVSLFMGILYVFTGGLCLIGTIVDLVNHRQLAFDYNIKIANEVSGWIARMPE